MLIGAHVSPAAACPRRSSAAPSAAAEAIQIFNQSPRMWRPTAYARRGLRGVPGGDGGERDRRGPDPRRLPAQLRQRGPRDPREVARLADPLAARRRRDRRRRGGPAPGSAKTGDRRRGDRARGRDDRARRSPRARAVPLHLENTAGAGGTLGRSFEELAALLEAAGGDPRLGVCLDSCHLLASGYDIRTPAGDGRGARRSATRTIGPGGSARCTSTTRRPRSAPTATATPTSARASSASEGCAAFLSAPALRSGCRACSRPPARTARARRARRSRSRGAARAGSAAGREALSAASAAESAARRERVLELGAQRRACAARGSLAEAQRAGAGAGVASRAPPRRAREVLDRLLEVLDRAGVQTRCVTRAGARRRRGGLAAACRLACARGPARSPPRWARRARPLCTTSRSCPLPCGRPGPSRSRPRRPPAPPRARPAPCRTRASRPSPSRSSSVANIMWSPLRVRIAWPR